MEQGPLVTHINPRTLALRCTLESGKVLNITFNLGEPIAQFDDIVYVPYFREPTLTVGGFDCYTALTDLAPDVEKAFAIYGEHPPLSRRHGTARFHNSPPHAGECIGFINCFSLLYCGKAYPSTLSPSVGAHIFEWRTRRYITATEASRILMLGGDSGRPIIDYNEHYLHCQLCNANESIDIVNTPTAPYETMLLIKILGAASRRASKITLVKIEAVEELISRHSINHYHCRLSWEVAAPVEK
jgi:hypothetical protein